MNGSMLLRRLKSWRTPMQYDLMPQGQALGAGQPDFVDAFGQWAQWCGEHAGACVQVNLSAHWCLVSLAEQPESVWQKYYGLSPEVLKVEWVTRQLLVDGGRQLACAVPRPLMQALIEHARQHHIRLTWVGPWWMPSLARHVAQSTSIASSWSEQEPGLKVCAEFSGKAEQRPTLHQLWCEALPA